MKKFLFAICCILSFSAAAVSVPKQALNDSVTPRNINLITFLMSKSTLVPQIGLAR